MRVLDYAIPTLAHHSAITEDGAAGTPGVGDDLQCRDVVVFKVPKPAPRRVAIDLKGIVLRTVEQENKCRVDDNGLEGDNTGIALEGELPAWGVGRSGRRVRKGGQEREERQEGSSRRYVTRTGQTTTTSATTERTRR